VVVARSVAALPQLSLKPEEVPFQVHEQVPGAGLAPLASEHLVEGPVQVLERGDLAPQVSGTPHGLLSLKKEAPRPASGSPYHRPGRRVIFGPSPTQGGLPGTG